MHVVLAKDTVRSVMVTAIASSCPIRDAHHELKSRTHAYRDRQAPALPAFVPMKQEPLTQADQETSVSIEVPFGQQKNREVTILRS
jgi:hypothetical protein